MPPILAYAIAKQIARYLDLHSTAPLPERLINEMIANPESTQQELADRLYVSQATVSNYTRALINKGKIERITLEGRRSRWVVKKG